MKSDVNFNRGAAILRAYRNKAVRNAVLQKFFRHRLCADHELLETSGLLRRRWRNNVMRLVRIVALHRPERIPFMRNCPPSEIMTDKRPRQCQHRLICPYCWSRYRVFDPFVRLETFLYGHKCERVLTRPVWLLEYERVIGDDDRTGLDVYENDEAFGHRLDHIKDKMNPRRGLESKLIPNRGGIEWHTVRYARKRLLFGRRTGILLLEPGTVINKQHPLLEQGQYFRRRLHEKVTKKLLAQIFGRVAAYPAGWFNATGEQISMYLDLFHRMRMLAYSGVLWQRAGSSRQ